MLKAAGRTEEAITWLRSRAEAGDSSALAAAADLLRESGRIEEAISFYQRAADAGDSRALLPTATGMLTGEGRTAEGARLHRYGIEPDGRIADPWEASVLA
jgi:TPR repeat protein